MACCSCGSKASAGALRQQMGEHLMLQRLTALRHKLRLRQKVSTENISTGDRIPTDLKQTVAERIFQSVSPYTMTSIERIAALIDAIIYLTRNRIAGAIVECGVWRGGSMAAAALMLKELGDEQRELYLYDTFTGMPPPGELDRRHDNVSAKELLAISDYHTSHVWALSRRDEVRGVMSGTGYDQSRIHYVEGCVEQTIPAQAPASIALLRLDTDWYESTRHELLHLFPRLVPGGILLIDDYGFWQGARRAVDEYFEQTKIPIHLCRIDDTGRVAVKPAAV